MIEIGAQREAARDLVARATGPACRDDRTPGRGIGRPVDNGIADRVAGVTAAQVGAAGRTPPCGTLLQVLAASQQGATRWAARGHDRVGAALLRAETNRPDHRDVHIIGLGTHGVREGLRSRLGPPARDTHGGPVPGVGRPARKRVPLRVAGEAAHHLQAGRLRGQRVPATTHHDGPLGTRSGDLGGAKLARGGDGGNGIRRRIDTACDRSATLSCPAGGPRVGRRARLPGSCRYSPT